MRIAIITGTRADWGLLTPLAEALRARPDIDLRIIATNMHLLARFGMTVDEITAAGFDVDARVDMYVDGDDDVSRVHAMARCMDGMADAFAAISPDRVIILGDRYEMLAAASSAAMMRIPVVHIAGGTISEGAIDNAIRHAITQLATLHLVETDQARHRVIQMGRHPDTVVTTGALGVWNITHRSLQDRQTLAATLDGFMPEPASTLLVTYHPATLDTASPEEGLDALLGALDRFPDSKIIITYPNNDAGGNALIDRIEAYAAAHPARVKAVPSLGMLRYLSALQHVAAVVGNSSSGIVEVPSMHIPTVDIGIRQRGRLCADSVIHCASDTDSIAEAIAEALGDTARRRAREAVNPYYRDDTLQRMVDAITDEIPDDKVRKFHDITPCP